MPFTFSLSEQHIYFGVGALQRAGEVVDRLGWQRVLVCTSASQRANGTVAQLTAALGGRLSAVYDTVQAHVPEAQVHEVIRLAEAHGVDGLIGLGGGSTIGLAKASSYALHRPSLAIPTTYAGSEMTPVFGITQMRDGHPRKTTTRDPRITPRAVIYDPALTLALPRAITATTGLNALAHCIEALYSITRHPLSSAAAEAGLRHIGASLAHCADHGKDLEARTTLLMGAHLAGAALASVEMGLHHGACHVLGGSAGVPHGLANAIVLPHAMRFNAEACAPHLATALHALAGSEQGPPTGEQLATHIEALVARLGQPQRLREAGVSAAALPELAAALLQSKAVQNNPRPLPDLPTAEAFLRAMW